MTYTINGASAAMTEPKIEGGTLWVPLREMANALGGRADWDATNHIATAYFGDRVVTFKIGETNADLDGTLIDLQAASKLEGGETWVPVRFFNQLGYNLAIDPQNASVDITSV